MGHSGTNDYWRHSLYQVQLACAWHAAAVLWQRMAGKEKASPWRTELQARAIRPLTDHLLLPGAGGPEGWLQQLWGTIESADDVPTAAEELPRHFAAELANELDVQRFARVEQGQAELRRAIPISLRAACGSVGSLSHPRSASTPDVPGWFTAEELAQSWLATGEAIGGWSEAWQRLLPQLKEDGEGKQLLVRCEELACRARNRRPLALVPLLSDPWQHQFLNDVESLLVQVQGRLKREGTAHGAGPPDEALSRYGMQVAKLLQPSDDSSIAMAVADLFRQLPALKTRPAATEADASSPSSTISSLQLPNFTKAKICLILAILHRLDARTTKAEHWQLVKKWSVSEWNSTKDSLAQALDWLLPGDEVPADCKGCKIEVGTQPGSAVVGVRLRLKTKAGANTSNKGMLLLKPGVVRRASPVWQLCDVLARFESTENGNLKEAASELKVLLLTAAEGSASGLGAYWCENQEVRWLLWWLVQLLPVAVLTPSETTAMRELESLLTSSGFALRPELLTVASDRRQNGSNWLLAGKRLADVANSLSAPAITFGTDSLPGAVWLAAPRELDAKHVNDLSLFAYNACYKNENATRDPPADLRVLELLEPPLVRLLDSTKRLDDVIVRSIIHALRTWAKAGGDYEILPRKAEMPVGIERDKLAADERSHLRVRFDGTVQPGRISVTAWGLARQGNVIRHCEAIVSSGPAPVAYEAFEAALKSAGDDWREVAVQLESLPDVLERRDERKLEDWGYNIFKKFYGVRKHVADPNASHQTLEKQLSQLLESKAFTVKWPEQKDLDARPDDFMAFARDGFELIRAGRILEKVLQPELRSPAGSRLSQAEIVTSAS